MKTLLVTFAVAIQQPTNNGAPPQSGQIEGDLYVNVDAMTQQAIEAVRNTIRQQVCKQFQGANGVVVGAVRFHSIIPIEESLIVRPR
jgi:hypothetical protein